jgi:hypothetical protein
MRQDQPTVRLTIRLLSPHHRLTARRETQHAQAFPASPREISLVTTARTIRTLIAMLLLASSAVASLSFAGSASASPATKCGQQVLTDWYDNGRIDKLYPLNCYEEAIDEIPSDIGPYVDAEDVITRALQGALHGNLYKGGCDPSADGSGDDCSGTGGGNGSNGGGGGNDGGSGGQAQETTPSVNTSSPSSVPIPLLVLGGMSILLLAAGALGYVSRRRQAAQADELDDSGNPPV